jgi:hypothetical protein
VDLAWTWLGLGVDLAWTWLGLGSTSDPDIHIGYFGLLT